MEHLDDRPAGVSRPADAAETRAARARADRALLERAHRGDQQARAELVQRFLPLARQLARRYQRAGEPLDDLNQVASLGLLKAIDRFEEALAGEARRRGFDGVVCGHIHHADMRRVGGVLYLNDGDWVESCTALVEHGDGRLELLDWAAMNNLSFFAPPSAAAARAA